MYERMRQLLKEIPCDDNIKLEDNASLYRAVRSKLYMVNKCIFLQGRRKKPLKYDNIDWKKNV